MTASKYRKKPVVIEAFQWFGDRGQADAMDPVLWVEKNGGETWIDPATGRLYIETLEGRMAVSNGDYIIKGVKGEFYPCKADIFEMTYDCE